MHNKINSLLIFSLLCACSVSPVSKDDHSVKHATKLPTLLNHWMPGLTLTLYQQVTIKQGDKVHRLENALDFANGQLKGVVLSRLGQRLATIMYNGKDFEVTKSKLIPNNFNPNYVLETIQMMYWPISSYYKARDDGWRIDEENNLRQVYYSNELIASIYFEESSEKSCRISGDAEFVHHIYDYQINVSSSIMSSKKGNNSTGYEDEFCVI